MTRPLTNLTKAIAYLNLLDCIRQLLASPLTFEEIMRRVVDEIVTAFDVQACWIYFPGEKNEQFNIIASQGLTDKMISKLESFKVGDDFIGDISLKHEPIIYPDVSRDPEAIFFRAIIPWMSSLAFIPFVNNGTLTGLLGVCSSASGKFAENELKVLLIVGTLISNINEKLLCAVDEKSDERLNNSILALGEKQGLIDTLGHELQTPLTALIASAGLLAEGIDKSSHSTQFRLMQNILHSASSLQSRIVELLELSRSNADQFRIRFKIVDISNLINEVVQDIAPVAEGKNQSVKTGIEPHIIVEADGQRLEQVLNNLLSNAIKFTPKGGQIYVSAKKNDLDVIIEVRDTGKGISYEEQQKLFRPYYRIPADRRRHDGLGLGLSITKQLVELHNGRIWVESELEKGSSFFFSIPLAKVKLK